MVSDRAAVWEFRVYWEIMEIVPELNGALCPGGGAGNNGEWAVNFSFIAGTKESSGNWTLSRLRRGSEVGNKNCSEDESKQAQISIPYVRTLTSRR